MRTNSPWLLNTMPSRLTKGPEGLHGGKDGAAGRFEVNGKPFKTKGKMEMQAGDKIIMVTPGGGGFRAS
jgi:N-methylhydantoinase B